MVHESIYERETSRYTNWLAIRNLGSYYATETRLTKNDARYSLAWSGMRNTRIILYNRERRRFAGWILRIERPRRDRRLSREPTANEMLLLFAWLVNSLVEREKERDHSPIEEGRKVNSLFNRDVISRQQQFCPMSFPRRALLFNIIQQLEKAQRERKAHAQQSPLR